MNEYPKIDSVYKRDGRGRFLTGEWSTPEIEYLAELPWVWTEKVDGTNIRISYQLSQFGGDHGETRIGGRTDNAQIPAPLLNVLNELIANMPLAEVFPDPESFVVLHGEGYGAGIQKGGQYRPDPSFVLFDVKVGPWWLRRHDVREVGDKLGIEVVPIVDTISVPAAIAAVREGKYTSRWPGAQIEGLVGRPLVDLADRQGNRIVTKVKGKDFK